MPTPSMPRPRSAPGLVAGARARRQAAAAVRRGRSARGTRAGGGAHADDRGREVVEDYRAVQLSLRAHPLAFLRAELERRGIIPARRSARSRTAARSRWPASSSSASGPARAMSPSSPSRTRPASPTSSSGSACSSASAHHPVVGDDRRQRHAPARRRGHPRHHRPAGGSYAPAPPVGDNATSRIAPAPATARTPAPTARAGLAARRAERTAAPFRPRRAASRLSA